MRWACLVLLMVHLRRVASYGEQKPTVLKCIGIEELGSPTGNNETFCNTVGGPPETRWNPAGPCYCAQPHARWYQPGHDGGPCTPSDGNCHATGPEPPATPPPIQCGENEKLGNLTGNRERVCGHGTQLRIPELVLNPSPCTCVTGAVRYFDLSSGCHLLQSALCPALVKQRDAVLPSEPKENTCLNKHDLCDYWARIGQCVSNRQYMERNCALACTTDGSCGQRSTRPYEFWNCGPDGKHPHCDDWVRNGDCKRNYLFMKDNCGKECANAELHRLDPEVLVRDCLPDV